MKRNSKIIKISILGILVNSLLAIIKALVGLLSNSIAVILDAVNNLSDALSSIITIIGIKLSNKKPDKEHPYGHGRIEYFSAIIIALIVLMAGVSSLKEAVEKIVNPVVANYSLITLLVILNVVFIKFFFGKYVKKEGEKLNSQSLVASGIDAISDCVISLSTFITAIISIYFKISLEGYIGIIISILIIKSAIEILKNSVNDIIGIRADSKLTNNLKKEIMKYDDVLGVHDLMLHNYGPNSIIATVHIDIKDDMTAKEIHRLTRLIVNDIFDKFGIVLTVGIYASNDKNEFEKIKQYVYKIIKDYENILEIHGFYVDKELKKISFDLIFNFEEKNQSEIIKNIKSKLKNKFPKYDYCIIIDTDISD